jgi:DNA repair protein RadC
MNHIPTTRTPTADLLGAIVTPSQAGALLARYPSLRAMARATEAELATVPGVGPKAARAVSAALGLSARVADEIVTESPVLDTPEAIASIVREQAAGYAVEKFRVLMLNTRLRLISIVEISSGILDQVDVSPREIFRPAILAHARKIVLTHNHPSGDPTPSDADIRTTRRIATVGKEMMIDVLDHVIMGHATTERRRDFVSMRELGYLTA